MMDAYLTGVTEACPITAACLCLAFAMLESFKEELCQTRATAAASMQKAFLKPIIFQLPVEDSPSFCYSCHTVCMNESPEPPAAKVVQAFCRFGRRRNFKPPN